MKTVKKKWEPRIINIMADGSVIEDLTGYVIPARHSYYDIIIGIHKREMQKGAQSMSYAVYRQEYARKLYKDK